MITYKRIKKIVNESIDKVLSEAWERGEFKKYTSGVFENNEELEYLEMLVYNLTNNKIKIMEDEYGDIQRIIWKDFIIGLVKLSEMAKEKVEFDRINIKQIFQEYVNNGREDEFWSEYDYEYLGEYIGEYGYTELWDTYMPTPEYIQEMSEKFNVWLERETEREVNEYSKNKWNETNYMIKYLNHNIY